MIAIAKTISQGIRQINRVYCRSMSRSSSRASTNVTIAGQTIHYELRGSGAHPVLLLPGALGSSLGDFSHQLENMDGDKFSLIGWDPPGYGQSRPPDRAFTDKVFHNDAHMAVQLMKYLGYDKFSVLGWSDGGITGLIMAGTYPQHLIRLVIWGANAYISQQDSQLYENVRDVSQWSERMRKPMEDQYGKEYFKYLWSAWIDALDGIYKKGGDLCKTEVDNISCPTLLVDGFKDSMVAREHPGYLKEHIKDIKSYDMPEGKHNLHMRFWQEFNKVVEDFLNEETRPSQL